MHSISERSIRPGSAFPDSCFVSSYSFIAERTNVFNRRLSGAVKMGVARRVVVSPQTILRLLPVMQRHGSLHEEEGRDDIGGNSIGAKKECAL